MHFDDECTPTNKQTDQKLEHHFCVTQRQRTEMQDRFNFRVFLGDLVKRRRYRACLETQPVSFSRFIKFLCSQRFVNHHQLFHHQHCLRKANPLLLHSGNNYLFWCQRQYILERHAYLI